MKSKNLLIATASVAVLAAAALVFTFGPGRREEIPHTCRGQRIVTLDLSSQNRSDTAVRSAVDVVSMHTLAAAICKEPLTVVGVAGGRQEMIAPQITFLDDLRGPNPRARANALSGRVEVVRHIVGKKLTGVYAAYPTVASTSIPALFEAAKAQLDGNQEARIVLLTTGVNIDQKLSLNRPLQEGEGRTLARELVLPTLGPRASVVVIGVTQMDGEVPVPGDLWPREVMDFTQEACTLTQAASCRVYQVTSTDKALL